MGSDKTARILRMIEKCCTQDSLADWCEWAGVECDDFWEFLKSHEAMRKGLEHSLEYIERSPFTRNSELESELRNLIGKEMSDGDGEKEVQGVR